MPSQEEINRHLERLVVLRESLTAYLKQQATVGSSFLSPAITHGIIDTREQIKQVKIILRSWNVPIEDLSDDESLETKSVQISSGEKQDIQISSGEKQNIAIETVHGSIHLASRDQDVSHFIDEYFKALEIIRGEILSTMKSEINDLKRHNNKLMVSTEELQDDVRRLREVISSSSIIEGVDEIREEIKHQTTLRKELIRRLRSLELEQARKGIDTPPQVETQISDIRDRITEIEAKIKILTYDLQQVDIRKS